MKSDKERQKYFREERRKQALEELGGKCVQCGSEENLEFDHINPNSKLRRINSLLQGNIDRLERELAKCQLLCKTCHREKTSIEQGVAHGEGVSGKKNCKCTLCVAKRQEYYRNKA